jgi:UDP-2-acetamido-3-amino-2,3-dideoxy-glucuronate N-acetyltransferase
LPIRHFLNLKLMSTEQKGFSAHPSAFLDEGCRIGAGTRIWHFCHIMGGAVIGERCSLGQNVFVADGVVLGNQVKVQNNVSLYSGVVCEDDVFLGPSMVFTNVINPRSAVNRRGQYSKTLVRRGASIGANATIVCDHTIGAFAFIGAGAVVTKDVPDFALMVGNPARQIGWMSTHGHRLHFNELGVATCPESGETYQLKNDSVTLLNS